jgi:hypothetical protein
MRTRVLLFVYCLAPAISLAAEDLVTKLRLKSVEQATDDFLKSVPAEDTVEVWIRENGPVYGNYCGIDHDDESFEAPCLSRLDCVCKAQAFGASLRRALATNPTLLESVLGKEALLKDQKPEYENFLQNISIKLFAAKLKGIDIAEQVKAAHASFQKQPAKAMTSLNKAIDENEAVREKIESINVERIRFEEMRADAGQDSDYSPKHRAVSTQPFNIIAGLFSLNYEQSMTQIFTLRFGVSFLGAGLITDTYLGFGNNKDFSAFFSLGLKSFVTGHPLKSGVYLEPFVDVGYENVAIRNRPDLPNVRDIAIVPALMLGAEKVFPMGIYIDLGIGGGYHLGIPIADNPGNIETMFLVPKFRASIGYAW